MSRKHFGTDGVRGVANLKLTPELAFQRHRTALACQVDPRYQVEKLYLETKLMRAIHPSTIYQTCTPCLSS